jgi:hypothetical protein
MMIGCLALVAGCVTTKPTFNSGPPRYASASRDEATCRLIGSLAGYDDQGPRTAIVDETKTTGPSKVIWMNPPATTVIRTEDGYVYRCNARL